MADAAAAADGAQPTGPPPRLQSFSNMSDLQNGIERKGTRLTKDLLLDLPVDDDDIALEAS